MKETTCSINSVYADVNRYALVSIKQEKQVNLIVILYFQVHLCEA